MKTVARYNVVLIQKYAKELKNHFKMIHDYNSNYKDASILSKQQHKEECKKINEMIKKFDEQIGNKQFYTSYYALDNYKKEIESNSNKKTLDSFLWCVLNQTMWTLRDLYKYEVMGEWK